MYKGEIKKILNSTRRKMVILFLILISLLDILMVYYRPLKEYIDYKEKYVNGIDWSYFSHPCYAGFLNGHSIGHIAQAIYVWLLPLVILLLYSDLYIHERKNGMDLVYRSKIGSKKFLAKKIKCSFLLSALLAFSTITINFIVIMIFFRKGTDMRGAEQLVGYGAEPFFEWQFYHPYLTYLVFSLLFVVLVGACGAMTQALAILIKDIKGTYMISFMIWIFQFALGEDNLSVAMQPFTEATPKQIIIAFCRQLIISIVCVIIVVYRGRKYEEI